MRPIYAQNFRSTARLTFGDLGTPLPFWALCEVTTGIGWSQDMSSPVCLDFGALVALMRVAGWGQPIDNIQLTKETP